jgi:ADP-ribose/FAD diphosphatase
VVGCLVECLAPAKKEGGKMKRHVLLCKRGIEPCRGLWTLPAGFQECEESTAEGAARETREEANAEVTIVAPYAHLDIPAISQTYFIYRATLSSPDAHSPGEETLETELYDVDSIPFDKIAFSSIKIVLQRYLEDIAKGTWGFHQGTIIKEPGVAADSPHFKLSNYMNLNTDHSSKL